MIERVACDCRFDKHDPGRNGPQPIESPHRRLQKLQRVGSRRSESWPRITRQLTTPGTTEHHRVRRQRTEASVQISKRGPSCGRTVEHHFELP